MSQIITQTPAETELHSTLASVASQSTQNVPLTRLSQSPNQLAPEELVSNTSDHSASSQITRLDASPAKSSSPPTTNTKIGEGVRQTSKLHVPVQLKEDGTKPLHKELYNVARLLVLAVDYDRDPHEEALCVSNVLMEAQFPIMGDNKLRFAKIPLNLVVESDDAYGLDLDLYFKNLIPEGDEVYFFDTETVNTQVKKEPNATAGTSIANISFSGVGRTTQFQGIRHISISLSAQRSSFDCAIFSFDNREYDCWYPRTIKLLVTISCETPHDYFPFTLSVKMNEAEATYGRRILPDLEQKTKLKELRTRIRGRHDAESVRAHLTRKDTMVGLKAACREFTAQKAGGGT